MSNIVPKPAQTAELTMPDGAIIWLRRYGNFAGRRLVLSHGNGLAMDFYYPFWRRLTADFDVVLYDFRNHGRNPVHDIRFHSFPVFVWDNETILQQIDNHFGPKPALGAFHSMSAVTSILHTLRAGPRWAGLVLFDPPITPPNGHPLEAAALDNHFMMADRSRQRPGGYRSYEEFADKLRALPRLRRFDENAHELMAHATLREDPENGGVVLRCPPAFEEKVFATNVDSTIAAQMPDFPVPIKLICGDPDCPDADAPSHSCRAMAEQWGIAYKAIPDTTHFLQVEAPEACVNSMLDFFTEQRLI